MLLLDPKMILDAICHRVGTHNYALFVGWSIGQKAAVASIIAEQFGTDAASMEAELETLIELGWLTTETQIPSSYSKPGAEPLAITHEGWLEWSYFDEIYIEDLNFESVDDWITDGIENTDQQACVEVFAWNKKPEQPRRRSIDDLFLPSMN